MLAAAWGVMSLACAPWPGDQAVDRLEAEMGGPGAVMDLLQNGTDAEVRGRLARHGIQLQVVDTSSIEACPQRFPTSDRDTWHALDGEFYYVEAAGRPYRAYSFLPPIAAGPRAPTCQGNVGRWGDAEVPGEDYDGGHLIGAQLGGWGGRANLVPQQANFNRGTWAALENTMADCRALPDETMRYFVGVAYPDAGALVPDIMTMDIERLDTGAGVSLYFDNAAGGGPAGAGEKERGVDFLRASGCGP